MTLDVKKTTPVTEPHGAAQHRRELQARPAAGRTTIYGHLDARDPVTGQASGRCASRAAAGERAGDRRQPRVPAGCDGHHCTPITPRPARSCGRTTTASAMPAASSATRAGGKQYIAVPAGWGSLVGDGYAGDVRRAVQVHADGCRRADRLFAEIGQRRPRWRAPENLPVARPSGTVRADRQHALQSHFVRIGGRPVRRGQSRSSPATHAAGDPTDDGGRLFAHVLRVVPLAGRPGGGQGAQARRDGAQRRLHRQPDQDRQAGAMPGFARTLNDAQIAQIVRYIRSLKDE